MSTSDYSSLSRLSILSLGEDKFDLFVDNLKEMYARVVNSVQPVPLKQSWKAVEEIFVNNELEYFDDSEKRWKKVDSHLDVITNPAKRIVVEGGPGAGKSTLCLQWVSEWCKSEESQLSQIDILLFLRMRNISKKESIYNTIKLLLLPKESTLTEQEVKDILTSGRHSMCFIIDGLNEAVEKLTACDIKSIIQGEMFPVSKVIITTRYANSSKILTPQMLSVRLLGFNQKAQEEYIKMVIDSNTDLIKNVRKMCNENVASSELLQNPLVFAMLSHIISENKDILNDQHPSTSYVDYIVKGFHYHSQYKKDPHKSLEDIKEDKKMLEMVGKLAFDGLCDSQRSWKKADTSKSIGHSCYEKYLEIGILVEETVTADIDSATKLMSDTVLKTQRIKFLDNVIQDFYAACYLQRIISNNKDGFAEKYMKRLISSQVGNVFVYVCGLLPTKSKSVIRFLTDRKKYNATAMLCFTECILADPSLTAVDKIENFRDVIQKWLRTDVSILPNDNILTQRGTANLLEMAHALGITVDCLILHDCFDAINENVDNVILKSGMKLTNLKGVVELKVNDRGRHFSVDEIENVLYFGITECENLKTVEFGWCLLPWKLRLQNFLDYFEKKNIQVLWFDGRGLHYRWELRAGYWAKHTPGITLTDGEHLRKTDYDALAKTFEVDG